MRAYTRLAAVAVAALLAFTSVTGQQIGNDTGIDPPGTVAPPSELPPTPAIPTSDPPVSATPTSAPPFGLPLTCSINPNVDFTGNDMANRPSEKLEGCCKICSDEPGCNAWSWSKYNGGTCWLKSAKGIPVYIEGVHSSLVNADPKATCPNSNENIDYSGPDVGNAWSATAEGCCDRCAALQGCGAYTWTGYNGGTCWFKSYSGSRRYQQGARSAVVRTAPQCNLLQSIDLIADDIGEAPAASAVDCCGICRGFPRCTAFTFTTFNNGTCWLKAAAKLKVEANDFTVVSGTV